MVFHFLFFDLFWYLHSAGLLMKNKLRSYESKLFALVRQKDTTYACMHIFTSEGNLFQNDSKIISGLDCHNFGLCWFCHSVVGKGCGVYWNTGVYRLPWMPCLHLLGTHHLYMLMHSDYKAPMILVYFFVGQAGSAWLLTILRVNLNQWWTEGDG